MSKTQHSPLAPPAETDKEKLEDFTSKIQEGLEALFLDAHSHDIKTAAPASNEGEVGDIALVNDGTTRYIAVRFADGWYKTATLTAI